MTESPALLRADADYPRWDMVAALIRNSFAYMEPILGHPPRAASLTAEKLAKAAAHGAAFLIVEEEIPAACLFTRPSRDFPDALYCGWLAVDPHHRGRGLARRLFSAAEDRARAQGFATLTLDTGRAFGDLHRLFGRLGFAALPGKGDIVSFRKRLPRRVSPDDPALPGILDLLHRAFAYMEGRIDPPSSLTRMTLETLRQDAATKELWILEEGGAPVACMILTRKPGTLYLGKLASDPARRRGGLARSLIAQAESRASALGLGSITLQTRVELTENHSSFRALGFQKTGETAHPGYDRPTSFTFTKII